MWNARLTGVILSILFVIGLTGLIASRIDFGTLALTTYAPGLASVDPHPVSVLGAIGNWFLDTFFHGSILTSWFGR